VVVIVVVFDWCLEFWVYGFDGECVGCYFVDVLGYDVYGIVYWVLFVDFEVFDVVLGVDCGWFVCCELMVMIMDGLLM